MAASAIDAVLIHAVYLLNCASDDPDIRAKSLASLTHSLRVGQRDRRKRRRPAPRLGQDRRRGKRDRPRGRDDPRGAAARARTAPLHLENTAGAGGTLGRSIDELAALLEACGGGWRLGLCLDSCHLFASGYDIRTAEGMDRLLEEISRRSAVIAPARCT